MTIHKNDTVRHLNYPPKMQQHTNRAGQIITRINTQYEKSCANDLYLIFDLDKKNFVEKEMLQYRWNIRYVIGGLGKPFCIKLPELLEKRIR